MKRNNKKGFTIVELVIVIAVIAILSAVLIPTFGGITKSAQEKADQATARNTYTQYIAIEANVEKDIDFVEVGGKYYDVDASFAVATPAHGDSVLNGNAVSEYCAEDNCATHQ